MSTISYTIAGACTIFLYHAVFITGALGNCGPPPMINNTEAVTLTFAPPGTAVSYKCDRSLGYYDLPGISKTIICQDDDTWSTIPVFCARACHVPERNRFSEPVEDHLSIYLPNVTVLYKCRYGFQAIPGVSNTVQCLNNFTWSPLDMFCERVSCGDPGQLLNGIIDAKDFLYETRITFTCNDGYTLSSQQNYIICEPNAQWSGSLPECKAVNCSAPEKPTNGSYEPQKNEYSYQNNITFLCDEGFNISGKSSASCTANGTWSSSSPVCTVIMCPAPDKPINGSFNPDGDRYIYRDVVKFTCNKGLEIAGVSSAFCTVDGTWSSTTPVCTEVICSDPNVPNSRMLSGCVGPHTLNHSVSFECVEGFTMNGSSSIICNVNGQWEPEVPQCLGETTELIYVIIGIAVLFAVLFCCCCGVLVCYYKKKKKSGVYILYFKHDQVMVEQSL